MGHDSGDRATPPVAATRALSPRRLSAYSDLIPDKVVDVASSKHKQKAAQGVGEDELTVRYRHLQGMLPRSVVDSAHAAAFAELSAAQRHDLVKELRPLLSDAERDATSEDPEALAALAHDVETPDAMMRAGIEGAVASGFVLSAPVARYFATGAGSLTIDQQPLWIQQLIDHEANPIDGGTMHHRKGVNSGTWFA